MRKIKTLIQHSMIIEVVFLLLYFTALTLLFTRPMVTKLSTHTVGGYGDNHYFMWIIGWTKQALFEIGQSPHKSFLLNFPYNYQLALTEIAPLQILIALPFAWIFDNTVLGYNIAMLSTFVLSGLTMYYWVKHLTDLSLASLVASTAYAFLPYHIAHMLSGHLNLVAIQWLPLFFWGFIEILDKRNFAWKSVILMCVGLSGIALSSQYYLFMTLFITLIVFVGYLIQKRFDIGWMRWKQLVISGLLALPASLVGSIPYYFVHQGSGTGRPLTDVIRYSASLSDYLLPFTKSFIAGRWVSRHFQRDLWGEATLYLGLPILTLAIYAIWNSRLKEKTMKWRLITVIALIALVLSMGTNLVWMEQPVVVTTPAWLRELIHQDTFYVYLPGYLLYRFFPFYNIMRAWMRYGIIVMVAICALAGYGVSLILKRTMHPYQKPAGIFLLFLVILDFSVTPLNLVEIKPRAVDKWLTKQPFGAQVQLPLAQSFEQRTIYATLTNQKPLIGQMNTYPSHRYFQLEPMLRNFPDHASVEKLREEDITYILVDSSEIDFMQMDYRALNLDFAGSYDGYDVFIIQD